MVDNAPLFRVFDEECNITQRLGESILWQTFFLMSISSGVAKAGRSEEMPHLNFHLI